MKLANKIKLIFITVLTFIAVLVAGLAVSTHGTAAYADGERAASVSIYLEVVGLPDRASNKTGDVTFKVMATNTTGKAIGGYQFEVHFDSTVFTGKSASQNVSGWGFDSQIHDDYISCVSYDSSLRGTSSTSFQLATVTFGRKAAKPAEKDYIFSIQEASLSDTSGNELQGIQTPSATFTYRAPHTDASIGEISVSGLDYYGSPLTKVAELNTEDNKYYVEFLYNTKTADIDAIVGDVDRGYALATVAGTGEKSLDVGANSFILTVTAEDEETTRDYEVIITRGEASSDHALSLFELNGEEVTIGEDGIYRATVPFMTDLSTMNAIAVHPYASVVRIGYPLPEPEEGEGEAAPAAQAESTGINEPMLIKAGVNELHISVLAEDGIVYPVVAVITRELPDVSSALTWLRFNGAYVENEPDEEGKYTIDVPFTTRTAKMNAEADTTLFTHEYAAVVGVTAANPVEDDLPEIDRPINNGINATFDLVQGENLFYVVVRYKGEHNLDADGYDHNVHVIINREYASGDKVLEYLKVNDEEIIPDSDGIYRYGDIPYSTYTIKVEAVAIDSAYVSKISLGTLSVSGGTVEKLTLLPGENLIRIEVTAQDGSTQEHELILNRLEANHEYVKVEFEFTDKQLSKFDETPNFFIGEDDIAEDNGEPIVRTVKAPKKFINFSLTVPESVSVDVLFFFSESYETVKEEITSDSGLVSPLAKVVKPTVSNNNLSYHIEKLDGGSNTLLLRINDSLSGMSKLCIIDIDRPIKGGVSPAAIVFLIIFLINMLVIAVLFILDSRNKVEVDETTYKIIVENGGTAPVIVDPSYAPTSSGKDEKKEKKSKKKGKEDDIELEGVNDNKSKEIADKIKMLNKVKKAKEGDKEADKAEEATDSDIQNKLDALKKEKAAEEAVAEEPKKEKKSLFGRKKTEETSAPEEAAAEEPKKEKKSLFGRKKTEQAEATKDEEITSKLEALKKKKAAEEPAEKVAEEEPKKEKKSLFGRKKTEEAPAPAEEPNKELTPQEKAALLSKNKTQQAEATKDEEITSKLDALKKKKAAEQAQATKDEEITSKLDALKKKKAAEQAEPVEEPKKKASTANAKKASEKAAPAAEPEKKAAEKAKPAAEPKTKASTANTKKTSEKAEPAAEPKTKASSDSTKKEATTADAKKKTSSSKSKKTSHTDELLTEIRDLLANKNDTDNGGKKN